MTPVEVTEQQPWVHKPNYSSDSDDRYRAFIPAREVPRGGFPVRIQAVAPGYRQPCRVHETLTADATLDVHLVADSVLSTMGIPPEMPVASLHISGRLLNSATGQPIAGGFVSAEFGVDGSDMALLDAATRSDADGRYLLCGVDGTVTLVASASGFHGARSVVVTPAYNFWLTPR